MKVLWVHNFKTDKPGAGSFLFASQKALAGGGLEIQMFKLEDLSSPLACLRQFFVLRRLVAAGGFDLIHSQFGSMCGLICAGLKAKKVLTLRGSDWYRLPRKYSGSLSIFFHSWLQSFFTRIAIRQFDAIICVSAAMRSEVSKLLDDDQVWSVPSPIDLELFRPLDKWKSRKEMGWSKDARIVVFPSLNKGNPIKRPALAKQSVEKLADLTGGVVLEYGSGYPPEKMPTVFSAADVVLMTSVYEGWPNSIKESLACGTPFVSTNVSDLKDFVGDLPGCSVCSDIPEEIAAQLHDALSVESRDYRSFVAQFSFEEFRRATEKVYSSICQAKANC